MRRTNPAALAGFSEAIELEECELWDELDGLDAQELDEPEGAA